VRVVVMGCGRVGRIAVGQACRGSVTTWPSIDRDSTAFHRLSPSFMVERVLGWGSTATSCCGRASKRPVPRGVSSGDNSNIISARVARETFGVERVRGRIYDAKRAAVYEVSASDGGHRAVDDRPLLNVLTRETETPSGATDGNVGVTELALHENWVGHRITDSRRPPAVGWRS